MDTKPTAPTVSSPVTYCQNATPSALSATATASHHLIWYTASSGGTGSATAPTPLTGTATTTSYWVSQVNDTTSCEGPRAQIDVNVKPTPAITATPHNPTSCGGNSGSIVISGLANGSYTVSYVRNGSAVSLPAQNASGGSITITGLNAGTYDQIEVTLNSCPSNVVGPFTLSDPSAPAAPNATVNGPICAGANLQLNANTVANATYSWSGPNGFNSTLQNPGITGATIAATGTYSVTVSVAGCASPAGTVNATVNIKPATPTVSAPDVCSGNTLTLTATSGTPGVTYSWTGPGGFTAGGDIATIANAPTTASGTYTVTTTLGSCSSSAQVTPAVKPTPVISAIGNNPTSCGGSNGSIVINGLSAGTYSISYKRNGTSVLLNSVVIGGSSYTIANLNAATYSEIKVTLNGCASNETGPFTLSDPSAPAAPTATAPAAICSGTNLQLNAGTVANATYSWSGPNSFSSTLQNPQVSGASTAASGTYSVTVTVAGCASPAGTVQVTVNPTPVTPTVSAPAVCSGNTLTLTASSSNAVTWSWTGPNSFAANTAIATVPNAATGASGDYTVTATLGTCSSSAVVTATVKPTPAISAVPLDPTTCTGTDGSIVLSGLSTGTYSISYVRNSTLVALASVNVTGTTYTISGLNAGNYDHIKVTLNGCPSNEVGPFTLSDPSAPAAPNATTGGPVCAGNNLQLNASTVANATYTWSGPNAFSNTAQNPLITGATTAATGTYSVTVTVAGCVSAPATVDAVVNPTPAQPTITTNAPVCSGNTLTLSAATTTSGTMAWSWTGPNSYSSGTQNLNFNNATVANSGTYTVTATLGSCPSAPRSLDVTVKPTPVISATLFSNPTNCNSSTGTITLKGLAPNTTYQVSYTRNSGTPSVVPLTSSATGDVVISGLSAGTYDAITVSLDGCPSAPVGPFQLVDPTPPATPVVTNDGPLCSGGSIHLTATSDAGATYSWSGPATYSNNSQNPTINNIAMSAAGNYSVTATVNGCTSATATTTIVVNQTPATPTVSSPSVCSGNTLALSASSATAAVTYAWSGPASFSSALQNPTIDNATAANAGTYTVLVTLGTCTSTGTTDAVVKPTPVISATSANPVNCNTATGSISLSGLTAPGTYTVTYTENASPRTLTNQTPTAAGLLVIQNLASGVYDHIKVSVNGCPSNELGPFSLVDPTPPAVPTAGNSGPVCSGNNLTLNASSATPGVTYSWTGPGSYANNSQNPTINSAGLNDAGTYSVTATLNGCTSAAGSTTVVVNPTPATPVLTIPATCSGSTLSLSATSTTAGVTYSWSGPAGFSSNLQNTTIDNAAAIHSGTYTATATLGPCSANGIGTAIVKPTPAITGTFTNPTDCNSSTGTITLSGLIPGTYTLNYRAAGNPVSVPNLTPAANGTLVIGSLPAGVYDHISVTLDGCPSNEVGPFDLKDPNPPATPVVTNSGPVCSGTDLTLSATTSTAGAVTWSWTGPNGFSNNQQNPLLAAAPMAAAGTYVVTATLNGCTSAAGSSTVQVNLTPQVPTVSIPDACSGNTLSLSASSSTPGVTYTWTGPAGFASALQNPTIGTATAANAGVYTVTVTLGSCTSNATANAVVKPTPAIAGTFSNPTNCNTSTGSISISGLSAGTYTVEYTFNGAPQALSNQTPNASGTITIPALPAGLYQGIRVVLNGCPSNEVGPFDLKDPNPPAAPVVGSNGPLCVGSTLDLTASPLAGGAYNWSGPNGFASTLQNPSISNSTVLNSGTYSVTVTLNNCVSQPASVTVVVNALAAAPAVVSPVEYCQDVAAPSLTAVTSPGATLNWYNTPTGGSALPSAPVPVTATPGTTSWYVSQTSPAGCEGARAEIQVVVRPDADAQFTFAKDTACWPFLLPIRNTSAAVQNGSYNWYANGISFATTTSTSFPGYTLSNPSDEVLIKLVAISAFGCKPDSIEHTFRTLPKPDAQFTASTTTGCGPLAVTFTNTTPLVDTFRYSWNFGNGQVSSSVQPGTIVFASAPTTNDTVYHVLLKAFNECDTTSFGVDITVSSKPKAIFTPDHSTGCSPMRVVFTNTSLGIGNSYEWIWDDGTPNTLSPDRSPVTHIFNTAVQDTFHVKLVASNQCGTDTTSFDIIAAPNPIRLLMAVNGPQQAGCAPHAVQFVNNTVGATGFQWNFGDGNTLSTTGAGTVTHTFLTSGTYNVQLTAFNGCTDTTMTLAINVFPKPTASFTADRFSACLGDSIHFTNNSSGATSYLWQFGDGNTSTLTAPAHAYTAPNTYNVKLIAYRLNAPGNVCSDSITVPVLVVASLPGGITLSDSVSSCVPFTVTFTNPNLPAAVTTWNFGDGNSGTGSPVNHTYTQAGTYLATLTSIAPGGCTYLAERRVRINAPAGTFSYPSGYICGGRSVRFDAIVSGTDTLLWNFGDGHTQATLQPFAFYTYPNPGLYVPSVTLASRAGCHLLLPGIDTIKVDRIVAGYTATQNRICGSTDVTFRDTSNVFFGIDRIVWDLGDGTGATGALVQHRYSSSGAYNIRQIVFSNSGCSDTVLRVLNVTVHSIPTASITAPPLACANTTTNLLANVQSVDPVSIYEWSVNGVVQSSANLFAPNFTSPGTYQIRLVVGTVNGCFDTATLSLTVRPTPVVTASPSQDLCLGTSTQLNATGNGVVQWSWAPIQGLSCTTCPNPLATPNATTPYIVTGTNSFGCPGYDTVVITIHGPVHMTVSDNDSICVGQSVQLLASGAATYVWRPDQYLDNDSIPNPVATPPVTTLYQVVGYDGWNCYTDTASVLVAVGEYPTVNLGPDLVLATGTQRPLLSMVTNGPIRNWSWAPAADLSCSNCPLPTATVRNDVTYTVRVTTFYGCSATDTLVIKAFCKDAQVFLPNAFSPDGDGVNDVFLVQGSGILRVKTFRIFNRWGELVFEKNEVPPNDPRFGWDGRVIGRPPVPDVYVYTVEVLCENGIPYTYKGNVTILK
ncbi:gliding motility-associated C-terminal domain-containing protein [Flaviaesturariibacter aridisoli]|uniref:gliding motility-associated C-terminal domain-containing protein n=1 Tax=Flaviaesturariibacter aridisoli TaxID=2545761 RepID=UPI001404363D|nr:gliding motility-associated C-terminal domain-containing protein [Flaviaesturariibacter aridisoli]